MITKFKKIKNLAVFKDFEWDKEVKDQSGQVLELKPINILYGRNYSGKTTLSRMVRAMETQKLSDKYENPEFCLEVKNEADFTHANLVCSMEVRVFNDDFVKENLKFIVDPDSDIESFAILGEQNNDLEDEIKKLEDEIGSNEEGATSGLYEKLELKSQETELKTKDLQDLQGVLDGQLRNKATGRNNSIKYQSHIFGDQNYDIRKLYKEIEAVQDNNFSSLSDEDKTKLHNLIKENSKAPIPEQPPLELKMNEIETSAKTLVEKEVGEAGKIHTLVKNAVLNTWVQEGKEIHENLGLSTCSFCGNDISENRWSELEQHFDEESKILKLQLKNLNQDISHEISTLLDLEFSVDSFYSNYYDQVKILDDRFREELAKYSTQLIKIEDQINKRLEQLIQPFQFEGIEDNTAEIQKLVASYSDLRDSDNQFTNQLSSKQTSAKRALRLNEIYKFIHDIDYQGQKGNIDQKKLELSTLENKKNQIKAQIHDKISQVEAKKRQLNDEEEGAKKVNEYLNNFFGHQFLSLQAVEHDDLLGTTKQIRFEIIRNGKKAHHMSEGECSLVSFCYFIAKLGDNKTSGKKPIIWIDDPISSLDGNHK